MKRLIKVVFAFFVILLIIFQALSVGASGRSFSWYCVHRKDHLQPKVDKSFEFIEEYDAYYIDKSHGDECEEKVIYLTFDAGYENGNVENILDVLKQENVTAAFFILGSLVVKNTALVERMFNEGHLVCNHTYSHMQMTNMDKSTFCAELEKLEKTCLDHTGKALAKYYRPPEGVFDEDTLAYAKELGYKTVFWSFAYPDWDNNRQMSTEKAKQIILENVHNGEVMLLHPTSSTNAAILQDVIRTLKEQGYRFGTLDELTGAGTNE